MSKLGVSMPILNQPMEAFPRMAAAADDAWSELPHQHTFGR
jgi:hypothetical protein